MNPTEPASIVANQKAEGEQLHDHRHPFAPIAQQRHRQQAAERGLHQQDRRGDHQTAVPVAPPAQRDRRQHDTRETDPADRHQRQEVSGREEGRHGMDAQHRHAGRDRERGNSDHKQKARPADPHVQGAIDPLRQRRLHHEQRQPRRHRQRMDVHDRRHRAIIDEAARCELHEAEQDEGGESHRHLRIEIVVARRRDRCHAGHRHPPK